MITKRYEDISILLGWFCGYVPLVSIIVAIIFLFHRSYRKSFQAFGVHLCTLAIFFIWFKLMNSIKGNSEILGFLTVAIFLVGCFFIPIIAVDFLKNLKWPK